MNKQTIFNTLKSGPALLLFALIMGFVIGWLSTREPSSQSSKAKPLYWVAPMDANYRRDEPGKSPMGMDLIPVYADDAAAQASPGVLEITPELQLQMGVRTASAELGQLDLKLDAFGRIAFDRTLVQQLSPRVTGWVDTLFVSTEGEAVRRGQPLYALYSPELIAAQERFLSALKRGNRQEMAALESELLALNLDRQGIEQLKKEGVAQRSTVFRAPSDGVIGMLKVAEGYFVEPGDLLMALGSLEQVWAELNIFASQVSLLRPRQQLSLSSPSYPGTEWQGEVDYIYPALTEREGNLLFRASIDNPKMLLKPNMQVRATIELAPRPAQLIVPKQAVIRLGDQDRVVLSLGEGRFKSVKVKLGESDREHSEILEGLEEGDRIVTSAHFLIDSESSKTSDFKRMVAAREAAPHYAPTWVAARVEAIDLAKRTLRLQHEKISAWNMPSMTMDFQASDELPLKRLKAGDSLEVRVADGEPLFKVLEIKVRAAESDK